MFYFSLEDSMIFMSVISVFWTSIWDLERLSSKLLRNIFFSSFHGPVIGAAVWH